MFRFVGDAVAVRVAKKLQILASDDVDGAVRPHEYIHRIVKALGESRPAIESAVAVRIGKYADAVAGRTRIVLGPLMRVRLDDQQPALAIEGQARSE